MSLTTERFIALVDNDGILESDAIVLLEGDGFNRYKKAADLYLRACPKELFLVEQ